VIFSKSGVRDVLLVLLRKKRNECKFCLLKRKIILVVKNDTMMNGVWK
jgi:hypothetical protein